MMQRFISPHPQQVNVIQALILLFKCLNGTHYLPSESRSSDDIRGFFAFQEKQASRKEQAPSSLVARNSSYDDVVSEDFLGLHE